MVVESFLKTRLVGEGVGVQLKIVRESEHLLYFDSMSQQLIR